MAVHLLRHAKAGRRANWRGDDLERPLTEGGFRQSLALAPVLAVEGVQRVLSSPSARCLQTVEALADTLGIDVETTPSLFEVADIDEVWALVESMVEADAVLCTHGNIVLDVLARLEGRGIPMVGRAEETKKGAWWTITAGPDGALAGATYHPPPD